MKYLKYFLIVSIALISISSNTAGTSRLSEGIYPGNLIPDLEKLINLSGSKINLSDLRGQKVLVSFWAAYDASSRRDHVLLSNAIDNKKYPLKMVSVSFDKNKSVLERTLAMDKIDVQDQLWATGDMRAHLFNRYQLGKGFKNYLIDEQGRVIAINLRAGDLDHFMN